MQHTGSFSTQIDALPDAVFARITDVDRLPEWNRVITDVVERPERLEPGAVWKTRMHALGGNWVSKAEVLEIDRERRRLVHRSQTDDGNPSYADWTWEVAPDDGGSRVTVSFDLHPQTFWRKALLVRIRRLNLGKEIPESLAALAAGLPTTQAETSSEPDASSEPETG